MQGLGTNIKNVFAGMLAYNVFDTIKDGFTGGIKMGMDFNSTMQQNQIGFEAMLGSADKAKKLLDNLSEMAANTPFEFPDLAGASKKMLAFGFTAEQIPGMLTNIGNAAAGLSLGADGIDRVTMALGQMKAKGKISGEEMLQLTEAGIPALQILADKFGMTTQEISYMQSKGLLPVNKSIDALVTSMGEKFPNMMEKQSKSFAGLMSTLKDNTQMALGATLKPLFNDLTNNLLPKMIEKTQKITDLIGQGKTPFEALKQVATETFGANVGMMMEGAKTLLEDIGKAIKFAKDNGEKFVPVIGGVAAGFAALKTIGLVTALIDLYAASTFAATAAEIGFTAALKAGFIAMVTNPIGLIVTGLGLLVAAGIYLWQNWDTIKAKAGQLWDWLGSGFQAIGDFIGGIFDKIGSFIGNAIKGYVNVYIKAFNFIINGLNKLSYQVPDWVPGIGGKTLGFNIPQIPMLAKGTGFFQGGAAIVGEKGPELVRMPRGAQVIPNNQTRRMLSNNNNSNTFAPNISITVNATANASGDALANTIKKAMEENIYPVMERYWYNISLKNQQVIER